MKLKLLLLLICITSTKLFSQPYGKQGTKDLPKVEFLLTDGSKADGFFVGFTYPNGTYPAFFDKDNIYNFIYKKTKSSEDEKFGADEVKSVKIYDEYGDVTNEINRLDMKYVDKDGKSAIKRRGHFSRYFTMGKSRSMVQI
ncbi:hypothetical protein [Chryseobacterium sp.]|uniref:hypothetical protein n=1 Tax=Chryseobacterium sp. TaxID=1871047 RepID=UPI00289DDE11|nr:hypothetical protein [Chryseobacterium sp.]